MVLDKPTVADATYEIEGFKFIINKEDEREVSYLEIDYVDDWSGEEFIITAGF